MAAWKFIVTDRFFTPVGELTSAFDVNLSRKLNGLDTGSFRIRSDNSMFWTIMTLMSSGCYIKSYRDGVLQGFQVVWTTEVVGDEQQVSLAITTVSPAKFLEKMVARVQYDAVSSYGVALNSYLLWMTYLWQQADYRRISYRRLQERESLPLFVAYPQLTEDILYMAPIVFRQTDVLPKLSDQLALLSAGANGFDWYWTPTEPTVRGAANWSSTARVVGPVGGGGPPSADPYTVLPPGSDPNAQCFATIATMAAARTMGSVRPNAVLEYGMGKLNLAGFQVASTREDQINQMEQLSVTSTGAGTGTPVTVAGDFASSPLLLQERSDFDVPDVTVLSSLMQGAVDLRQYPRIQVAVTLNKMFGYATDPPNFGTDFALGDVITVRIASPTGDLILNGSVRVYAVSFVINENGSETVTLTVQKEA